jgi:lipopolysaccharide/colanic/teichoic acid biosynthesis glycosyltransferase
VHWNIAEYGFVGGAKEIQFLGKFPTVTWSNKNYRIRYKAIKRAADIVIGAFGTVLLLFVYILAVVGHAMEHDNGHVILGFVRVGRNGRRFYEYRFRVQKNRSDGDSKTGRFLQTIGLANLPMAWNVLWGDMSIVGVEAPSLPQFLGYSRSQRRGLSTKPGVIQFWPAYYWTRKNNDDLTVERCEAEYVEHWSLLLDVKILLRTLGLRVTNRSFRQHMREYGQELCQEERKTLLNFRQAEQPLAFTAYHAGKKRPIYHAVKRVFDVLFSLVGLIVLSPVVLLLVVLVRMEDGQNVFYRQLRIGRDGKKIYIYKIRTMRTNVGDLEKILTPEQYAQYQREFKIENDPRVTKIGNILRKTSLDELPQLLNILRGDLSLVGPRPIVEKETEVYGDELGHFLSVRPGLTGYWQAYARNNATYESGERQKMELYYADHQSLWLDIRILFKTVGAVLKRDGAM